VRYSLYGLDEVRDAGFDVAHNLDAGISAGVGTRAAARGARGLIRAGGGYGGDFTSVLASRAHLNRADVVFSTVDTVGIPAALLARAGLVRPPLVYAAIGLPERLEQLRGPAARGLYFRSYRKLKTIVAYGWGEVDALREWLGPDGPQVLFLPFGVDIAAFAPDPSRPAEADVVSLGADPRRDLRLLAGLARRRTEWSFRVVTTRDQAGPLTRRPRNLELEFDIPFDAARDRLASARVVVLPVRDNSYSGATTVLLQAMALGRPVVVSRTAAISRGYHLEDGLNCRLVPPGDLQALDRAVAGLLADGENAAAMGARARRTVEEHLGWGRYAKAIADLLAAAVPTSGRT
jgi:glycosyltransferase involved in cell wall biosynthesis